MLIATSHDSTAFLRSRKSEVQHDFSGHVTPLVLVSASCDIVPFITQLHSLCQENQIEIQHAFIGHVMPLTLASHDVNSVINGNIAFLM